MRELMEKSRSMPEGVPAYIFGSDGDTVIMQDNCDESLVALPAQTVLKALRADARTHDATIWEQMAVDVLTVMSQRIPELGRGEPMVVIFNY